MEPRRIIKSLEVSDFRGLEGNRTLDFESADIILLLGLNGFGKTSVFDSIEWCLTGKLGRYERYTETGRKQDFGKEKEVLRNKYATNPNTFAKVTLENGTTFGRRVLSTNSESDYNMGSTIDGCQYGLDSITKETVKTDLVNSYFSATHILSQETINHFVTSKKPEERYQALSVNFGTAIFTPFENNIQMLLTKISDSEKEIKQEITSKTELISSLKSQMGSKAKDVSNNVKEANELIEHINNLSADTFHKEIVLNDDMVVIDVKFEEYISSSKSRANLDYNEEKERANSLQFLKENIETWKDDNKELESIEISILKIKESLVELEGHQKLINSAKIEISSIKEKLKSIAVQKSNVKDAIKNLPHYLNISKKINELEVSIQKLRDSIDSAKEHHSNIEGQLEKEKTQVSNFEDKLKEHNLILNDLKNNEEFFNGHQALQRKNKVDVEAIKSKREENKKEIERYRTILSSLDMSNDFSSLKSIIEKPDYSKLTPPDSIDKLEEAFKIKSKTKDEIKQCKEDQKRIAEQDVEIRNRLSNYRQILSSVLTQIDQTTEEHSCPVCDVSHKTQSLVHLIENKLGSEESNLLSQVQNEKSNVQNNLLQAEKRHKEIDNQIEKIINALKENVTDTLSEKLAEVSSQNSILEDLLRKVERSNEKYNRIITDCEKILGQKLEEYTPILNLLTKAITLIEKSLEESIIVRDSTQVKFSENEKLIRDGYKNNEARLSEIESLKDSKYFSVQKFLEDNGIKSEISNLESDITKILAATEQEERALNSSIKDHEKQVEAVTKKREIILKEKNEDVLRKNLLEKDTKLSKIKQSLSKFLQFLNKLNISPDNYTVKNVKSLEVETEKSIQKQEDKFKALDRLLSLVPTFKEFNNNNASRKKMEKLESEIDSLKNRNLSLKTAKDKLNRLKKTYPSVLKGLIKENLDVKLFNQIYELLNPHRRFKIIDFKVDVNHNRVGINFNAKHSKITARPEFLFSSAQLNTFGICMFLSMALRQNWLNLDTILIDDPIQNLDDINVLSFIDFLRSLLDSKNAKKQIILSTHDERFYDLMLRKFQGYNLKSFRFESYGKLTPDILTGE